MDWAGEPVSLIFMLALNFKDIESTRAFFNGFYWDDEDDVTMIFQLAVPCTGAGDLHLQILAALSRKLIYDEFRDQIAAAASAEEILALIGDQIGVQ